MGHYAHTLTVSIQSKKIKALKAFKDILEKNGDYSISKDEKDTVAFDGPGAKIGVLCFNPEYVLSIAEAKEIFAHDKKAYISCEYTAHDNMERGGGCAIWEYNDGAVDIHESDEWQADNDYEFFERIGDLGYYWSEYSYWGYDYWRGLISLFMIGEETGSSPEEIVDALMECNQNDTLPAGHEDDDKEIVELLKMAMVEHKLEQSA